MGKVIGSVVLGYVVMVIVVFVLMSLVWMVMGASGAFQPGSWDVSAGWIVGSIIVGLVAAIIGGYVCALVAKDPRGPKALVVVVVILGIVFAIPVLTSGAEAPTIARTETISMMDAMQNAQQPVWIALLNPILGAIGVLIGARLRPTPTA
ncbi:MAG: hypothetical protein HKM89_12210 [Gemmatimonadales bacterium]|nr:hypothetical protein [Gemmatimonadales bacterium]